MEQLPYEKKDNGVASVTHQYYYFGLILGAKNSYHKKVNDIAMGEQFEKLPKTSDWKSSIWEGKVRVERGRCLH